MSNDLHPFVKWAGGKTQLLEPIIELMPKEYNEYYEPFIGGGALLLNVKPENAHINDNNLQLVNCYKQIKNHSNKLLSLIDELDSVNCDKEFYLKQRERYNQKILNKELDCECAALMIWINKHCFNGLYRVNSRGLFNVPYNNKCKVKSVERDNIIEIGKYLKNVSITSGDFEKACSKVQKGDFVYFDSPYVPEGGTADFTSYTKDGFNLPDHERLADLFKALDSKGALLMLSNNDVPLVRELYKGYNFKSLEVHRNINRDGNNRKGKEVIITNY